MELLVQFTVIAGFVGGIVGWAIKKGVIAPLKIAITALQETIAEFKEVVTKMQESQHEHDKRLCIVEEQIKVANHRINDLEKIGRG